MKQVLTLLLAIAIVACKGQETEKQEPMVSKTENDTLPRERSSVRKEYDVLGNLIRYDSIYSWSYPDRDGDSIMVNLDSIMDSFRKHFQESPLGQEKVFFDFPKKDSLFMKDFFKKDYYHD